MMTLRLRRWRKMAMPPAPRASPHHAAHLPRTLPPLGQGQQTPFSGSLAISCSRKSSIAWSTLWAGPRRFATFGPRRFGTCGRRSSCFFAARACRIVWISCSSSPRRGAWRKSAISEAEPDRGDFKGVVVLFPEEWYPELDSRCMKVQKLLGKVQRSTLMLNSVNAKNHVRGVAVCERGGH